MTGAGANTELQDGRVRQTVSEVIMETQQQSSPAGRAPEPVGAADRWPQAAAPSAERVREMLGWRLIPANAQAPGRY